MTVVVKPKTELMVPRSVRRKAGIKPGDHVEFIPSDGSITIRKREARQDDEHTPAQRRAVDRGIAKSEKDYKAGRSFGPFQSHEEFISSLHSEAAKLGAKKNRRPSR
jgi:AbrB family looped-hinge helix DNA binding protein